MIICLCHRVSDRDLRHHAAAGAEFEEVQVCTGAGTGCGQCVGHARAIFERSQTDPAPGWPAGCCGALSAAAS